jgi:hypothetical protein
LYSFCQASILSFASASEFARYERAARKLGVTVAKMIREGADLYIQMRGRDGSPNKETKK